MNTLLTFKNLIFDIKSKIECLDPSIFSHNIVENCAINQNTVSIVMTSSNRSKQIYFTLTSMIKNNCKDIQIIIVDDSSNDQVDLNILKTYPFYIDFIQIKRENKIWHNPLVNYNLGFQFVKGCKVIIQNAEVCHVGNVIDFVNTQALDDKYYTFDVRPSLNFDTNEEIYKSDITGVNIFNKRELYGDVWYQSSCHNRNFHFLTAMTRNTFDNIGGFSYDCTMGTDYDDDDFLLKILSKGIAIVNIFHTEFNMGGIHLYHSSSYQTWDNGRERNDNLFNNKKRLYNNGNGYIDVSKCVDNFDAEYQKLL